MLLGVVTGALSGACLVGTGPLYCCLVLVPLLGLVWLVQRVGGGLDRSYLSQEHGLLVFLLVWLANGGLAYVLFMMIGTAIYTLVGRNPPFEASDYWQWILLGNAALGVPVSCWLCAPPVQSAGPPRQASPPPSPRPGAACPMCQGQGKDWLILANHAGQVLATCPECRGYGRRLQG